jgi:hypothetical protein
MTAIMKSGRFLAFSESLRGVYSDRFSNVTHASHAQASINASSSSSQFIEKKARKARKKQNTPGRQYVWKAKFFGLSASRIQEPGTIRNQNGERISSDTRNHTPPNLSSIPAIYECVDSCPSYNTIVA